MQELNLDDLQVSKILHDTKEDGKSIDWRKYKISTYDLLLCYFRLGLENKAIRLQKCGSLLVFKEFLTGIKKLHSAYFCKVRLCPMCAWRRSLKVFGQVSKIMDYLEENHNYKYIFLSLTVKNVSGELLSSELDELSKAFNLLTKRKEFKAISKGWFRCLEVTHNWNRDDYHPHFHMVIAVNKSYFDGGYITHKKWVELWKSCIGSDYDPYVDIRTVKTECDNGKKAVAEVAKYAVKLGDYIAKVPYEFKHNKEMIKFYEYETDKAVSVIDRALHNRRLIAFGGKFKEVHKKLNLDDTENGDLVNTDNDEMRDDLNYVLVKYFWNDKLGNYVESEE